MALRNLFLVLLLQLVSLSSLRAGEKAYLHLDNSAYFLGDMLRMSAYVMDTDTKRLTDRSKVLYVEFLSSEGNMVEQRIYPLVKGKCAGDIWLSPLILSGLFEIRAYTRYMQNEGEANCFSQVIPVYEQVANGQYRDLAMRRRYTCNNYKPYSWIVKKKKFLNRNKNYQQTLAMHDDLKPLYVSSKSVDSSLVPFGCVTIKLKGKPNANISMSVVDNDNYMSSLCEDMSNFVGGNAVANEKCPVVQSYNPEQGISLYGRAYEEKFKIGKGNQTIPISFDSLTYDLFGADSNETQISNVPNPLFKKGFGLFFLSDIFDIYFDKLWSSVRTISLPGEYPRDNTVPKATALFDFEFDLFKYTDLLICSDDAVCNEYSYAKRLADDGIELPAVFGQSRFVGRNRRSGVWSKDSSKPFQICCAVPDMSHEWDKYLLYNSIQGYRYVKIFGYSPTLPCRLPDYSKSHPEHAFRRTLYWNPDLQLDENGEATIQFYNNGTCKNLHISGEGVSNEGRAIIVK